MPEPNRSLDELTARSAMLSLWAAGAIVGLPALARPESAAYYLSLSAVLFAAAVGLHLTRRRMSNRMLARVILLTGSFVGLFAAIVTGGTESPAYQSYAVVVIGSAWLVFEPAAASLAVAVTVAAGPALIWAGQAGWLPTPWVRHTTWSRWLTAAAACTLFAVVQRLELKRLRTAVEAAQAELTRREHAQVEVARGEARYAEVVSTVPGVVYEYEIRPDGSRAFTFVSDGARWMFGVSPEEALRNADAILGLVVPESQADLEASIARSIETLTPWQFEGGVVTPQGDAKWLRAHSLPTTLPDGTVRWHGVLTDVTASRRVEQSLREAEATLNTSLSLVQAALESTADGILIVDAEGKVTGYNQKFLALWRIPQALADTRDDRQLLSHVLDQLVDPGAFLAKVDELYERTEAISFDTLFFKDDRCFERYSQPQMVDGVSVGRVWSFRDVSARVADEQRRKALEQQLQHSQKMEALGTLSGGIAHDFNNLLSVIIGQAELAQLPDLDLEERRDSINEILEAGERASDLVRQIREFSQPRPPERSTVILSTVVQNAIDLLRSTFPRSIEVRTDLAPDVMMSADPTQLQQVVTNLAVNARQAIGEGNGRIDITLALVGQDALPPGFSGPMTDDYACLAVADTGHGMVADVIPRIFEPFFTTKEAGRGSGLGLAVVHGIVQRHGGAVEVESASGQGSCFRVYFPAHTARPVPHTEARELAAAVATAGERRHLLVVDDDERVARVMALGLERMGYVVTVRTDPTAAVALFSESPAAFDLVVTDLSMPKLSGIDLARQILAIRPGTALVLVTGFSAKLTPERARDLGFRQLVHKPTTLSSLAEAVHRALGVSDDL
jgi:signal transduction histidine kinase/ActR/RegA family two-component response regulator